MTALAMTAEVRAEIAAAVARARASPIPWADLKASAIQTNKPMVTLPDRPENFKRRPESQFVQVPVGFLCAISFEHQPQGLARHLSVSLRWRRRFPMTGNGTRSRARMSGRSIRLRRSRRLSDQQR
jgi:hypothetical protein